jgi:hypothetical protein
VWDVTLTTQEHPSQTLQAFPQTKSKPVKVYAIEPFVTLPEAAARVEDAPQITIYRLLKAKSTKSEAAKRMLKYVETNFRTLPFAERWLVGVVPAEQHKAAFKELFTSKAIMGYPVFVEVTKKLGSAEHTLLIRWGCEVLTKLEDVEGFFFFFDFFVDASYHLFCGGAFWAWDVEFFVYVVAALEFTDGFCGAFFVGAFDGCHDFGNFNFYLF